MEKGIAEFIRLLKAENDAIMKDATGRVSNALVRFTPVDTGEAVADWDVRVNGDPGDPKHQPDPSRRVTRQRLQEEIAKVQYGDYVIFDNDDPVAVRLEFGYSKKAPQGMVRLTARKWRGFVRGAARAAQNRIRKSLTID